MRYIIVPLAACLLLSAAGEAAIAAPPRYRRPPAYYRARPIPPVAPTPYVQPFPYYGGGYSNPNANHGGGRDAR